MSLFSLGHDCAHDSFSIYPVLNDAIGQWYNCDLSDHANTTILFRYYVVHVDIDPILSMEG